MKENKGIAAVSARQTTTPPLLLKSAKVQMEEVTMENQEGENKQKNDCNDLVFRQTMFDGMKRRIFVKEKAIERQIVVCKMKLIVLFR